MLDFADGNPETPLAPEEVRPQLTRLNRDLLGAAKTLTDREARYLVDCYYQMQEDRIRADARVREMSAGGEPCRLLDRYGEQAGVLERQLVRALDGYAEAQPIGRWCKGIVGIGPVIAAGLIAHLDITLAPTVGHFWRIAGLDPTRTWEKGQKRPWNAALKVVCWKVGESFVKVSNHPRDVYGKVYAARKLLEQRRNDEGAFAEQAAAALAAKRFRPETGAAKAYRQGKLPPAHIHARAKRYAVKLSLAHLHGRWYQLRFGRPAPLPYAVAHLGHAHVVPPPDPN
jgi:hypothetical protein